VDKFIGIVSELIYSLLPSRLGKVQTSLTLLSLLRQFINVVDVCLLAVSENMDEVESVLCAAPFTNHIGEVPIAAVVCAFAAGRDADDVSI